MSQSARPALTFAVMLAALLLLGLFFLRGTTENREQAVDDEATVTPSADRIDVQSRPVIRARSRNRDRRTTSASPVTTGVRTMPVQTPSVLPPLTGYTVERFDTWTTFPAGFTADGIVLRNGAITLAGDSGSTASRTGVLVSPPRPLRNPALSAPVEPRVNVPDGAEILMEISLSEDGEDWTPWARTQRYAPPDGNRVRPAFQARLSTRDLQENDTSTSAAETTITGPAIKYRLTLTSRGIASPSISDIRIWKQEYQ